MTRRTHKGVMLEASDQHGVVLDDVHQGHLSVAQQTAHHSSLIRASGKRVYAEHRCQMRQHCAAFRLLYGSRLPLHIVTPTGDCYFANLKKERVFYCSGWGTRRCVETS